MKKSIVYILSIILLIGCSIIAKSIPDIEVTVPGKWLGYYSPKGLTDNDILREYYRIDTNHIAIKNISFNFNTGEPIVQNGSLYYIKAIKENSDSTFKAILKNTLVGGDTNEYAFGINQKDETTIEISSPKVITSDSDFEQIINDNKMIFNPLSKVMEDIASIIPPNINPDLDMRPFLTKIANGEEYNFWKLTPLAASVAGSLLGLVNMGAGSRVVVFNECLKDGQGNPILYKGLKIHGYAYKDTDSLDKPSFPLHYTPKNHKYGIYWFKGNWLVNNKNVYLPLMISGDYIFGGYIKMFGKEVTEEDWKFFDKTGIAGLMQYNLMLQRSKD